MDLIINIIIGIAYLGLAIFVAKTLGLDILWTKDSNPKSSENLKSSGKSYQRNFNLKPHVFPDEPVKTMIGSSGSGKRSSLIKNTFTDDSNKADKIKRQDQNKKNTSESKNDDLDVVTQAILISSVLNIIESDNSSSPDNNSSGNIDFGGGDFGSGGASDEY